jgi:hypothetical protein
MHALKSIDSKTVDTVHVDNESAGWADELALMSSYMHEQLLKRS